MRIMVDIGKKEEVSCLFLTDCLKEKIIRLKISSGQTSKKRNHGNFGNFGITAENCYFEKFGNFQKFHNLQFAKFQ